MDASPGGNRPQFFTASFYKFVDLPDHASLQAPLLSLCQARQVKGLVLLAPEGINGSLAGAAADVQSVLDHLRQDPRLADLVPRISWAEHAPYHRMKVRLKKEIVTMGMPGVDPALMAGTYVAPKDWNALIADPDVVLIDTRNDYEVALGTFEGAINPDIDNFGEYRLTFRLDYEIALSPKGDLKGTAGIRDEYDSYVEPSGDSSNDLKVYAGVKVDF
jgi:UPF0176 protein